MSNQKNLKKIKREQTEQDKKKSFLNGLLLFTLSFFIASSGAVLSSVSQAHLALVIIAICLAPILSFFVYGFSSHKSSIWIALGNYGTLGFAIGAIPHLNDLSSAGYWIPLTLFVLGGCFLLSYTLTQWFHKNNGSGFIYAALWGIVATIVILASCSAFITSPYQWYFAGVVIACFTILTCSLGYAVSEHREGYVSAFCQAHFVWLEPLGFIALLAS